MKIKSKRDIYVYKKVTVTAFLLKFNDNKSIKVQKWVQQNILLCVVNHKIIKNVRRYLWFLVFRWETLGYLLYRRMLPKVRYTACLRFNILIFKIKQSSLILRLPFLEFVTKF